MCSGRDQTCTTLNIVKAICNRESPTPKDQWDAKIMLVDTSLSFLLLCKNIVRPVGGKRLPQFLPQVSCLLMKVQRTGELTKLQNWHRLRILTLQIHCQLPKSITNEKAVKGDMPCSIIRWNSQTKSVLLIKSPKTTEEKETSEAGFKRIQKCLQRGREGIGDMKFLGRSQQKEKWTNKDKYIRGWFFNCPPTPPHP